ncbi:superoxide dismutase [Fe] [Marinomonas rhizomae]|uniref:Fe-Mn family superoxide dismutase n=1 Tax=Marinomonas rhizomae TaxID=491948 RepID=UPI0021068AAC|nr:Fe-Mn family superoxide dismutase [Marinomonas rhizomae]UTW01426.1 superoxide dismutase [Fe] [Marinomonas rhizomae]
MAFELPALPYAKDALEPHMSVETLEYHYGKHHNTYVVKLNGLVPGSEYENKTLEEIIVSAPAGPVFNNAAQIWNHTFFWNSLSPNGGGEPTGALADAINAKWGSFAEFQAAFEDKAVNNFGSSWTWLVKNADGSLDIANTSNAGTPMTNGQTALITVDLWEHAYYIDYRNVRPDYLKGFWALANWEFASANFAA